MNFIARTNASLEKFPPLVVYTIGAADATILVLLGIFLSKISQ